MGQQARVTAVDAISDFRAALLVYIGKVRPLLDDAADEVSRTGDWLRVTRRVECENQIRARTRQLTDAQQALFSAELAKLRAPSSAEVMAVQKARRAVAETEEKLRVVKKLASSFEKEASPRLKQIEGLRSMITTDLQKGAHFLERVVRSLDAYVAANAGTGSVPAAAAVKDKEEGGGGA